FFFFQAEDGIRDRTVTGVQTCALPISTADIGRSLQAEIPSKGFKQRSDGFLSCSNDLQGFSRVKNRSWKGAHRLPRMEKSEGMRSEERRVGKEWRSGRAR